MNKKVCAIAMIFAGAGLSAAWAADAQPAGAAKSKEAKMQNAMSAAPAAIGMNATLLDWPEKPGGAPVTLKQGSNGWTCLPDNPASPGNDPMCMDRNAMPWLEAYMAQKKAPPKLAQPGISYMLQGGSDASNTDPFVTKPADGKWMTAPPHIMLFPAGKLDPNAYGTSHDSGGPWIMWAGTPYEHLMIPAK